MEQFAGRIEVDIRDSVPDWTPFEPPKAPKGSPNVIFITLDDVGFSAMSGYGGPIPTPNIDRISADGVRYTQFHTTALCSPTRSCLLTGRNHTRNSMACITEAAVGFPAASGTIPPENGMLSEILGELGWNTYMVGKWHLCPTDEMNLASTRRNWPSGRGFERWYGFLGAETSQWYPELIYDNHPVDQPSSPEDGLPPQRRHHRQGNRVHPRRQVGRAGEAVLPLLLPRRMPRPAPRAQGVDRQVQGSVRHGLRGDARADLGPAEGARRRPGRHRAAADQPDRHSSETRTGPDGKPFPTMDVTRPWDSLSAEEQRLFSRMAEVYAGFLAHADDQIGRLLDFLEFIGERDNTLVMLVSDNGASGEGGPHGSVNEMLFMNGIPDDINQNLAMLDELGGPKTYNHYPNGWAMAFNTPFKMWKRYEFEGGTADPCIISWPAGMKARGELRTQYHHAIDLVPTVLDVLGVTPPRTIKGHVQSHFDGVSMRYSFDDVAAPGQRATQFYSMLGSRGIWHDGWKAVTTHPSIAGWSHFNDDEWELYHTDVDRSEVHNLAAEHPDKVRELVALWFAEAGANGAFPLDDRSPLEIITTPRPILSPPRNRYVYFPDCAEVPETQAVNLRNRSFSIGALVDISESGGSGVLIAQGSRFGGFSLYIKDNRLHYVNSFVGMLEQKVVGTVDIPTGKNLVLSASFDKTGEAAPGRGRGHPVAVARRHQGRRGHRSRSSPGRSCSPARVCASAATVATRSPTTSATNRGASPVAPSTASLVDVSGEPYVDLLREAELRLAHQ